MKGRQVIVALSWVAQVKVGSAQAKVDGSSTSFPRPRLLLNWDRDSMHGQEERETCCERDADWQRRLLQMQALKRAPQRPVNQLTIWAEGTSTYWHQLYAARILWKPRAQTLLRLGK
jgi:hypothetical protein